MLPGEGMNAVPCYHRLCHRVSHIWGEIAGVSTSEVQRICLSLKPPSRSWESFLKQVGRGLPASFRSQRTRNIWIKPLIPAKDNLVSKFKGNLKNSQSTSSVKAAHPLRSSAWHSIDQRSSANRPRSEFWAPRAEHSPHRQRKCISLPSSIKTQAD